MNVSAADLLREAVREHHSRETFEKALGRTVRNHGGRFEEYMELIKRVRDRARRDGTTFTRAARAIADDGP